MTPEQEQLLERVRVPARELAAAIVAAGDGGIPPAVLLPELITILRQSGFQVPAGVGALLGRFGG